MLASTIEYEVQSHLSCHAELQDAKGRCLVVRNGYLPPRKRQTRLGDVDIEVPRIRDNSGQSITFHSSILPPYLKRTKSVEELLPWIYLKGYQRMIFQ